MSAQTAKKLEAFQLTFGAEEAKNVDFAAPKAPLIKTCDFSEKLIPKNAIKSKTLVNRV